jgi:hypothetical protein
LEDVRHASVLAGAVEAQDAVARIRAVGIRRASGAAHGLPVSFLRKFVVEALAVVVGQLASAIDALLAELALGATGIIRALVEASISKNNLAFVLDLAPAVDTVFAELALSTPQVIRALVEASVSEDRFLIFVGWRLADVVFALGAPALASALLVGVAGVEAVALENSLAFLFDLAPAIDTVFAELALRAPQVIRALVEASVFEDRLLILLRWRLADVVFALGALAQADTLLVRIARVEAVALEYVEVFKVGWHAHAVVADGATSIVSLIMAVLVSLALVKTI